MSFESNVKKPDDSLNLGSRYQILLQSDLGIVRKNMAFWLASCKVSLKKLIQILENTTCK